MFRKCKYSKSFLTRYRRIEGREKRENGLVDYLIKSIWKLFVNDEENETREKIQEFQTYSRYFNLKVIGSGAYGTVLSAEDSFSDNENPYNRRKCVAIKKARTSDANKVRSVYTSFRVLREVVVLRSFNHPGIVKLLKIQEIPNKDQFDHVYIITELMDSNLKRMINNRSYSPDDIPSIMYQILCALKYIHSAGVIHRDLKPDNILIDSSRVVKICDFGSVYGPSGRLFSTPNENYVVTRYYRAPELIANRNQNYFATSAIDMWSIGCIMSELYRGYPVFRGSDDKEQFKHYIGLLGFPSTKDFGSCLPSEYLEIVFQKEKIRVFDFNESYRSFGVPDLAIDLIKRCLSWNVKNRVSVEEALNHPFFKEVRQPCLEKSAEFRIKFEYEYKFKSPEDVRKKIYEVSMQYNFIKMFDKMELREDQDQDDEDEDEVDDEEDNEDNDESVQVHN